MANRLLATWSEEPPIHVLLKAMADGFFGKPKSVSETTSWKEALGDVRDILPKSNELFGVDKLGMPEPVLNFEELREKHRKRQAHEARKKLGLPLDE